MPEEVVTVRDGLKNILIAKYVYAARIIILAVDRGIKENCIPYKYKNRVKPSKNTLTGLREITILPESNIKQSVLLFFGWKLKVIQETRILARLSQVRFSVNFA